MRARAGHQLRLPVSVSFEIQQGFCLSWMGYNSKSETRAPQLSDFLFRRRSLQLLIQFNDLLLHRRWAESLTVSSAILTILR